MIESTQKKELAVLCELDNKAYYERFALTETEFSQIFADQIKKGMPMPNNEGDSWTMRPMVHIWYRSAEVDSEFWNTFFTDMEWGLPESDIDTGNLAYVCADHATYYRDKLMQYELPAV